MSAVGDQVIEFIVTVARQVVDEPDKVEANIVEGIRTFIIELTVADDDIGKVIGREGRMAQALRTMLTGVSTKLGKKVILDVMD
jgi:uncharacterized protein